MENDLLRSGYFTLLSGMSQGALAAAALLDEHTARRRDSSPEQLRAGIIELSAAAGDKLHSIRTRLLRDFITPLERGDIFALSLTANAVLSGVRSVADSVYIYSLTRAMPGEDQLSEKLRAAAAELAKSYGALGSGNGKSGKNSIALAAADETLRLCDGASQSIVAQRRACAFASMSPAEQTVRAELYEKYYYCYSLLREAANCVSMTVLKNC